MLCIYTYNLASRVFPLTICQFQFSAGDAVALNWFIAFSVYLVALFEILHCNITCFRVLGRAMAMEWLQ